MKFLIFTIGFLNTKIVNFRLQLISLNNFINFLLNLHIKT